MKNSVINVLLAISTFTGSTMAIATERFELPKGQQVHDVYIESTEDVEIYYENDVWINGTIRSDARVMFVGYGDVYLNDGLVIDGFNDEMPTHVDFKGGGDIYINTPIETSLGVQSWPHFGSKLFVNADITSGGHLSLTGPNGGTAIGTGVTIQGNTFYSDGYDSAFYMAPGSVIKTKNGIGVIATFGITILGELMTAGHIQINARHHEATVNLERAITHTGEGEGTAFIQAGKALNIKAPLKLKGKIDFIGNSLNLYDTTISSDDKLNFYSEEVNAYGGRIEADHVCFYNNFNNYGAEVNAVTTCQ